MFSFVFPCYITRYAHLQANFTNQNTPHSGELEGAFTDALPPLVQRQTTLRSQRKLQEQRL